MSKKTKAPVVTSVVTVDEVKLQSRVEALRKQLENATRKLVIAQNPELKIMGEKVSAARKRSGVARRVLVLKQKKYDRLKKEVRDQFEAVEAARAEAQITAKALENLSHKLDKIKAGLGVV